MTAAAEGCGVWGDQRRRARGERSISHLAEFVQIPLLTAYSAERGLPPFPSAVNRASGLAGRFFVGLLKTNRP